MAGYKAVASAVKGINQMAILDPVKEWLFRIALSKAIKRVVQLVVAFSLAHLADPAKYGLTVAIDPEKLTAVIYGGIEVARNYLKHRFPSTAPYL